jgi:hypothetical protein
VVQGAFHLYLSPSQIEIDFLPGNDRVETDFAYAPTNTLKRIGTLPDKSSLSQTAVEVLQNWRLFLDYWTN